MRKKKEKAMIRNQHSTISKMVTSWGAPELGWLKFNVDASLFSGTNAFAIGMVVRDAQGEFLAGKTVRSRGEVSVMEAEAFGVLEALKWLEEMGYYNVIVESDCLLVVDAIAKENVYQLEVGDLLQACRERLKWRSDIQVCFVKKQANKAAHMLARHPCLLDSFIVFMSPPDMLLETLYLDFSVE